MKSPSLENADPIAAEALAWVVKRMDKRGWSEADQKSLLRWRALSPKHDQEYLRHESIAEVLGEPEVLRDTGHHHVEGNSSVGAQASGFINAAGRAATTSQVLEKLNAAVAVIRSSSALDLESTALLVDVLLKRGEAQLQLGEVDGALADFDAAESQLILLLPHGYPTWREDLARVCSARGVALMRVSTRGNALQAVTCFERALEFLAPLVATSGIWISYAKVTALMNKGDAQFCSGVVDCVDAAIATYEDVLTFFKENKFAERPLLVRRCIVAHLNVCGYLLARDRVGDAEKAIKACDEVLMRLATELKTEAEQVLLASAHANRAAAAARIKTDEAAGLVSQSVHAALAVTSTRERTDVRAAHASVTAVHAFCVMSAWFVGRKVEAQTRSTVVTEAMRLVNVALRLARRWEAKGPQRFSDLVPQLFLFGAQLAETYQPHAMGEFLVEHAGPRRGKKNATTWRVEFRPKAIALLSAASERMLKERIAARGPGEVSDYFLDSLNAMGRAYRTLSQR